MNNTLIIVESPTKAKKISEYLGDKYTVLASYGHICDLAKTGFANTGVNIDDKFTPKYILMTDKVAVVSNILNHAATADLIILASDGDREGEAISLSLYNRLLGVNCPIKRMVFNEIKKSTIEKSLKNLRDIDINLSDSQETRRILDRLVGFLTTPYISNVCNQKLSAGRVQSVVTRLIVDRENEISSFIPEDFWTINLNLDFNNHKFSVKYDGRPTTKKDNDDIVNKIKSDTFFVSEVKNKVELLNPPAPLITSSLQRLMSKNHGMAADVTMKAAQELYEQGFCSYIRTDSVRCSKESLDEVRDFISQSYDLPKKPNIYNNKNEVQDAHECLRPTEVGLKPDNSFLISDHNQKLVYEMIWKYFVASQMKPAEYDTLKITIKSNTNKLIFKTSGKALKYKGFLEVLDNNDKSKIDLPNLKKGDIVVMKDVISQQKKTQPQPRFSEDTLIKQLETKNIGRPATYADLLSKICSRNYVEKKGSCYYPTELGTQITNLLVKNFNFMDYNYTSDLESKLDLIELGKENKFNTLTEFFNKFKTELNNAYLNEGFELCDKCSAPMLRRKNKTNGDEFLACSQYPRCYNNKPIAKENK